MLTVSKIQDFVRKHWRSILVVFVFLLILRSCSKKSEQDEFSWQVEKKVKVTRGAVVMDVSATGEIKPQNRLEVKPPISARVEEIFVKEGDVVKRGELIAELSSTERATLLDAVRSKGTESLDYWKEAYRPTPLIAPIDGTIIVRAVEPGQTVDDSEAVVVISDRLIIDASVNETDVGHVEVGQTAAIVLDAYPERTFTGSVDHIAFEATLEQNVNIYHVDVLPVEVDPIFRSGMTAQVMIRAAEKKDVLTLPQEAVLSCPKDIGYDSGSNCVASGMKKDKPVWKEVKTGLAAGAVVEIASGLKEGDTVSLLRKMKNENRSEKSGFGAFGSRRRTSRD